MSHREFSVKIAAIKLVEIIKFIKFLFKTNQMDIFIISIFRILSHTIDCLSYAI